MSHKKINILHLRDSPWVDGPGRTILETASLIDTTNYNYIIGAFTESYKESNSLLNAAKARNLNVFSVKEKKSFDFGVVRQVIDYIEKNDVHIVHTHEVRSDLYGLICAKKKKIKLVTTLHGWIANDVKSKMLTFIDRVALHFFDMIIVVSEKMKQEIMCYRIPERKIYVLRNSIIVGQYIPCRSVQNFRKEFNVSKETRLIGNIGRLSPEKGQFDFIQAASKIIKENYNVKFVLIGDGPEREKLKQKCAEYKILNSVIFTGYRKDMNHIYNSLDLVVQSSYTEGMPNVILESLLMGIPVIATDVGGTSEIVKNNVTGILIKPGNVNILASNIKEFLGNRNRYLKMTESGREYVKRKFNFQWRTEKLSELYDNLIEP